MELFAKKEGFPEFSLKKSAQAYVSEDTLDGEKVILAIPDVYMNHSGKSAAALVKSVSAAKKMIVVRDDLDMPIGSIKMTVHGRGSGGHKGIESIMRALKTKEFVQIKIGISGATAKGNVKKPKGEEGVVKHVIGKFKPSEEAELKKTLQKACEGIRYFITDSLEKATLTVNTK